MNKLCLKITISIAIVFLFSLKVNAITQFSCNDSVIVDLSSISNPIITHNISIKNESDKYIIDELEFNFPYGITNPNFVINGNSNSINLNGNNLIVNIYNNFIPPSNSSNITLTYNSTDIVKVKSGFNYFYLPKLDFCNSESKYSLILPININEIKYSNILNYNTISDYELTYNSNSDSYYIWGNIEGYILSPEWKLDYSKYIPLPSKNFSKVTFESMPNGINYYVDSIDNELLEINTSINYNSSFKAYIEPIENITYIELKDKSIFKDIINEEYSNEYKNLGIKAIYNSIIDKFKPILKKTPSSLTSINDILSKETHESLEYAYAFSRLLENSGYSSNIYYGIINLPIVNETIWHFWIGVLDENNNLVFYDPFIDDLLKFDQYQKITPDRYIWGVYNNEIKFIPESMHNITNVNSFIFFNNKSNNSVLGASNVLDVILKKSEKSTKGVEIVINNLGSEIIYISKILLNGNYNITGDYEGIGIIPQTSKTILLDSEIPNNLILSNIGNINASIYFTNRDGNFSINTNNVQLSSHLLLILSFLVLLSVFFFLLILIIQKRVIYKKNVNREFSKNKLK